MAAVLRVLADVIRGIATVLQPFSRQHGQDAGQLGVPHDARTLAALATPLPGGIVLPEPQGVFPRFVEDAA